MDEALIMLIINEARAKSKKKVWDNLRNRRAPEKTGIKRYFTDLLNK
jgi:hypothetical protein